MLQRLIFLLLFLLSLGSAGSQTLGGASVYNFLKLPSVPLLSAAGGVNVSYAANDPGLAANNPALLQASLHGHAAFYFNSFFAGIRAYGLAGAYHNTKAATTFGGSLAYLDYGSLEQRDAAGNGQGSFRPQDLVLQASAAKTYGEHWQYGLTGKFIHSSYGQFRSSGVAFDFGILYRDSARLLSAGVVAKNMGVQLSTYAGTEEELPFELQVGVSKRLARAPFGFSLTLQQAHRFDIDYNDRAFNNENGFSRHSNFATKLFNHLVIATHVYAGRNLELALGYNFLRRSELNIGPSGNGLNGFSAGGRARFNKLDVQYARAYFSRNGAYNQIGVGVNLQQVFGSGL